MAITIFITPPFTYQVLPTTAIPAQYQGNQIVLDGCPGEYRSASFTVKPDTDTTINVSATMPGLEIDVRAVKCWWQNKGIGSEPWHVPFTKTLTPELLLKDDDLVRVRGNENYLRLSSGEMWISNPNEGTRWTIPNSERTGLQDTETLQPVSVPAGTNKQFWVTVHIPEGTPAGTYTGQITVNGTVINIILTVYPFKLEIPAVETNIYYSSQFHSTYSTICGPKGELQLRAELRNMRQHGIENYFMEQWSNYVDHAQNISDLQRHLQIRKEEGFTSPNLYYSGPKIYNYFEGSVTMAELVAWVQEVKSIAAPYDFTDVYFYGRDEVEGQDLYDEIPVFDAIHNAGGKIFLTTSDTPVDAPIPSAGNRTLAQIIDLGIRAYGLSSAEAAKWHTQGHRLFNYGNPQGGVEEPMLYRRNYGLKLWQKDYDGGMTYSVNGNMYDPWNDFDHATYKDEMMVYPTVNGCVDTIQWEGFREGINDLRYLNTLLKAIQTSSGDTAPAISYLNSLKAANLDSVDMDTVRSNLIQHLMFLDSAMAKIFIIPGITDTRILPRSVIPAQYEGDTINLRGSPGEFLPVSFVLQTTTSLTNLTVNPSNLVGPATIPASAIDIKIVKVWYQAGVGIRDVSHKQLVPELLLNDDSFIKITNTGENWIKLTNGTYRLISTPADTTTNV